MKISNIANGDMIIKARNKEDYINAELVAERMTKNNDKMAVTSSDEDEMWVQVCMVWDNFNTKEFKDEYQIAKKELGFKK